MTARSLRSRLSSGPGHGYFLTDPKSRSRRAIKHLKARRVYIQKDSEQDAAAVAERIVTAVELLRVQPHIGRPGRVIGTRELVVTGTPYIVPYRVRKGAIELIAIIHGRQKWAFEA